MDAVDTSGSGLRIRVSRQVPTHRKYSPWRIRRIRYPHPPRKSRARYTNAMCQMGVRGELEKTFWTWGVFGSLWIGILERFGTDRDIPEDESLISTSFHPVGRLSRAGRSAARSIGGSSTGRETGSAGFSSSGTRTGAGRINPDRSKFTAGPFVGGSGGTETRRDSSSGLFLAGTSPEIPSWRSTIFGAGGASFRTCAGGILSPVASGRTFPRGREGTT